MHEGKPHTEEEKKSITSQYNAPTKNWASEGVKNLALHKKQEDQKKKDRETYTGPTENVMSAESTAVKFKSPPVDHTISTKRNLKVGEEVSSYEDLGIKPGRNVYNKELPDSTQTSLERRNKNVGGIQTVSAPHEWLMGGGAIKSIAGKVIKYGKNLIDKYPT
jgi:hypothetical protein